MDVEKIIASIEATAKAIDGKIMVDASTVEELKAADTSNKELIAAEQAKTAEMSKELETVKAQVNALEVDKVVAEAKTYVLTQEAEMVEAERKATEKQENRKKDLAEKGFADEKIVATAISLEENAYEAFVSSLITAREEGKAQAEKTIAQKEAELGKEDLTKAKSDAKVIESHEMDLGLGGTIKDKMAKLVRNISTEIKK
ncbi:hypothetical protein EOM82_07815 [bacterium]|nr:hypothetical protein [bacterium]